jgi:hypothetical protein
MKTTKERTRIKLSKRAAPARKNSRKPVDLAEIRQQITNLVGNDAVGMVEITMEEVGKGHYLGMKYLFEMIGLYPATGEEGALVPDSMAAVLMRRLGLPETTAPEQIVTKDQETAAAVSDEEGLE